MDKEINPCPRCKGHEIKTVGIERQEGSLWRVQCSQCGKKSGWQPTKEFAIKDWNRRADNG